MTVAAELLSAIYARPDDLEARAVYADWLSDHGDPRGEFISLQLNALKGTQAGPEKSRIKRLLKDHQRTWLGPLAETLRDVEWKGGFIDQAELAPAGNALASAWAQAANEPQLATLRTLYQGQGTAAHYTGFLLSPHTHGLTRAEVPNAQALQALLAGRARAFQHLCLWRVLLSTEIREEDWRRVFPHVRTVDLELPGVNAGAHWAVHRLTGHPALMGLERLRVFSPPSQGGAILPDDVFPAFLDSTGVKRLELHRFGMMTALWRTPKGLAAQLIDPVGMQWDYSGLSELPTVVELEIVVPPHEPRPASQLEELLNTLRRRILNVTLRREPKPVLNAMLNAESDSRS